MRATAHMTEACVHACRMFCVPECSTTLSMTSTSQRRPDAQGWWLHFGCKAAALGATGAHGWEQHLAVALAHVQDALPRIALLLAELHAHVLLGTAQYLVSKLLALEAAHARCALRNSRTSVLLSTVTDRCCVLALRPAAQMMPAAMTAGCLRKPHTLLPASRCRYKSTRAASI